MISVFVPTADRPHFLDHALSSIKNQSRTDLIGELIVSNNGTIDVSEIVKAYDSLPIRYVDHPQKLTFGEHVKWLVAQSKFPFIAMLADDDMWGRYHLEEADQLLRKHPDAVAVFNQTVAVQNASRQLIGGFGLLCDSFSSQVGDPFAEAFVFGRGELLIDVLVRTPLNIWSMVARKTVVGRHLDIFTEINAGVDSDRLFVWRLNTEGVVVAGCEVGLYMRCHPQMAGTVMRKEAKELFEQKTRDYTKRIIEDAKAMGIPVQEKWDSFWGGLCSGDRELVFWHSFGRFIEFASELLESKAANQQVSISATPVRSGNVIRGIIRDCLPPVLTRQLRKIRGSIGKHGG